jgi:hypothetical protein
MPLVFFHLDYFSDRVSCFCLGLVLDPDPLTYASQSSWDYRYESLCLALVLFLLMKHTDSQASPPAIVTLRVSELKTHQVTQSRHPYSLSIDQDAWYRAAWHGMMSAVVLKLVGWLPLKGFLK